ncbi:DNA processing protein DprA [Nocardiopsis sp. TSRI0078]|uniref:DNA-processing protein DprA n=1 Tax=unclassified Nocardiopsis TaxID=2649073 RepID=UPI00093E761F|nr:DNA-processing protein DprA [Nocardiopsis sp. TSRI0078]OKI14546.1 DNA processing protein DprA [Nocardiopsis sp. TSRI0078]
MERDTEGEADARARACLTAVAPPGDLWLGAMLAEHGAARVWAELVAGAPPPAVPRTEDEEPGPEALDLLHRRWRRWSAAAAGVDPDGLLADSAAAGIRFVAPGDPEWPGRLDGLDLPGGRRSHGLWVRGGGDLRNLCLRSVAVVGARSATAYGEHVAAEMAYELSERAVVVVSGGAYGIDGAAHRAAHAVGSTVVVLACGLDVDYPRGHAGLFADVARTGVLVSERPVGSTPRAPDFLVRNRLIAALTPGTVVVEAGRRSGALNTASHAAELNRVLMAVPGPVTSAMSVGCHLLLRDWHAGCVTCADDVLAQVGALGEELPPRSGPLRVSAELDRDGVRVLEAVPRSGAGPAVIAAASGLPLEKAMRVLGMLAATGLVERCHSGWRLPR